MAKTLNREFAAAVLVEALFTTDVKAAAKYEIEDRTIRNWRARMAEDTKLFALFKERKTEFDKAWAEELSPALRKGVRTLVECVEAVGEDSRMKKSPQVIDAISGAVKTLAEIQIVSQIIDARIAEQGDAPAGEA
jgi:hypothetical protein